MSDDINVQLIQACRSGEAEQVECLRSKGADCRYQDGSGCNSLMAAAESGSVDLIKLLLEEGVPWNAIDKEGKCAGEYAQRHEHEEAAQILLNAGVQAELLLGLIERRAGRAEERAASEAYLIQDVTYDNARTGGALLSDEENKAVMMQWEGPLMQAHARAICSRGGSVLNIGFGLGLIDNAIQDESQPHPPATHTIVEAHPAVLKKMKAEGWDQKKGVRIVEGRWQDVMNDLGQFDGIFFDTYSEFYDDQRDFHSHLPRLLKPNGIYSYFNGLGADNPFFYSVYCELVKRELAALKLHTEFISLPVDVTSSQIWEGVGNKYWQLDLYKLPIVQWQE